MRYKQLLLPAICYFSSGCSGPAFDNSGIADSSAPVKVATIRYSDTEQHRRTANGMFTYCLYAPAQAEGRSKSPITILLDPHAEAAEVVGDYRQVAENTGHLLLCSEDFQNGLTLDQSNAIISGLVSEAVTVLHADPAGVHLVGFSGGAKAAIAAAATLPGISTVTYCGAAFPPGGAGLRIPSLGIAGTNDMNFSEVLNYTSSLDTVPYLHTFLVTDDNHAWPDASVFTLLTGWADAWHCRNTGACDSSNITTAARASSLRIERTTEPVTKDLLLHFHVAAFHNVAETSLELGAMKKNQESAQFRMAMERFIRSLDNELQMRKQLAEALQRQDLTWWRNEVARLQKSGSDAVNARLLGYVSLAAYSYSRSALDATDRSSAGHYLALYEIADPTNPEWAFLRACLSEQSGQRQSTVKFLRRAQELGFSDVNKIREEKWLQGALSDPGVLELLQQFDQPR